MYHFQKKFHFHTLVYSFAALILVLGLMPVFGSSAAAQGATTATATPTPLAQENLIPKPDVTVIISERYLNQLVDEALAGRQDLQNPVVDLQDNHSAQVSATMPLLYGISVRPRAMVNLSVINGKVQAKVISFNLNGLGVPRSIVNDRLNTLEDELNLAINNELVSQLQPAGLQLTRVTTNDTQMTIEMKAIHPAKQP